jgi:hypothetical protein
MMIPTVKYREDFIASIRFVDFLEPEYPTKIPRAGSVQHTLVAALTSPSSKENRSAIGSDDTCCRESVIFLSIAPPVLFTAAAGGTAT